MASFREVNPAELDGNFINKIREEWMLIGAERDGRVNMMTASWGGIGNFWNKSVAVCVIRRERFTHPMVDATDTFSLTFFGEDYREQLNICGKQSGRDIDKVEACGFHVLREGDTPYFEEADLVLICRKVAKQPLLGDAFIDRDLVSQHYAEGNFHDMFFGEIVKAYIKG